MGLWNPSPRSHRTGFTPPKGDSGMAPRSDNGDGGFGTILPAGTGHEVPGVLSQSLPAGMPWWLRYTIQIGIGTVIALFLLFWLRDTVDRKLDLTVSQSSATATAMEQAKQSMSEFAGSQARQMELMLLLQRQICANTAKNGQAADRCWAMGTAPTR